MSKIELLICEDNKTEELLLQSSLYHLGDISFRKVSSKQMLLEIIDELSPDIILTDLMLPDTENAEIAFLLKERFPKSYIVVISGKDDIKTIKELQDVGILFYLTKSSGTIKNLKSLIEILVLSITSAK